MVQLDGVSNMTDKELIELAAKAIGVCDHGEWFDSDEGQYFVVGSKLFDPLNDDGDALRLAVNIGMLIDVRYTQQEGMRYNRVTYWQDPSGGKAMEFGDVEADPMAATRRAITRAAAQIGKEME